MTLFDLINVLSTRGTTFVQEDCENNNEVYEDTSYALRRTASSMASKGRFLKSVPWLVVEADDPESALECFRQLSAEDTSRMDSLALWQRRHLLPDLAAFVGIHHRSQMKMISLCLQVLGETVVSASRHIPMSLPFR